MYVHVYVLSYMSICVNKKKIGFTWNSRQEQSSSINQQLLVTGNPGKCIIQTVIKITFNTGIYYGLQCRDD